MRAFLDRFTNTRESAAHKRDDLLNSSVARSPPTSPSPKADFYAEDPKFFAGATRADRKDDSAFAIKSLSFCSSRF
ncbi:hypothetical protein C8R48DRAFT_381477 [Suillus tomentosus]|nr:hypothetical protein C8R48DRAFT_381477 [Suillus tomentosus]